MLWVQQHQGIEAETSIGGLRTLHHSTVPLVDQMARAMAQGDLPADNTDSTTNTILATLTVQKPSMEAHPDEQRCQLNPSSATFKHDGTRESRILHTSLNRVQASHRTSDLFQHLSKVKFRSLMGFHHSMGGSTCTLYQISLGGVYRLHIMFFMDQIISFVTHAHIRRGRIRREVARR